MLEYPVIIIFLIGLACLLIPGRFKEFIKTVALIGSALTFAYGIYSFVSAPQLSLTNLFMYKAFSGFVALSISFFCFIVVCFSLKYADLIEQQNLYYGFIFWTAAFSIFAVYSSNLIALLVFWGLSGMTLYLLANLIPQASNASKKSFIIIGGSDAFMVLGIAILWMLTGSLDIFNIRISLAEGSTLATVSFLCLAVAALTKAGAMPFHSWIPDFADTVPMSLTAFLPGAIDKLLGIYLLVLICNQLFIITTAISLLLLLLGSITIVCAVYMAMIQHNIKKLLAYHAVSQVGYMILGIATGSPLGIAAGVFHMINNAIYKSTLFLTGASVEYRTQTTELDKLGGLGNYMPLTFSVCLIASLSISGIPPFNGFASKWMIYQSLIQQFTAPNASELLKTCYLVFIVTAMFGSALTLASFVKLIHSIFLGQPSQLPEDNQKNISEVKPSMMLPMIMLAALCVLFGIFPFYIPLKHFIYPSLASFNIPAPIMIGFWHPYTATILILTALICGVVIYAAGIIKFKASKPFVGGEDLPLEAKASGPEFYRTVSDIGIFNTVYKMAEKKFFDIYDVISNIVLSIGRFLSFIHTGSLHTYLLLFLLGFAVVILYLR
jgi:formate hydrogenlyase subunit 3/multisubunit Na+/H+ antiporter MnhD subunit